MRFTVAIVCALALALALALAGASAGGATAAPPPAGGLEPVPGAPCIGSTTLATGCPTASPVLQGALGVGISPDGRTVYAATTYGGGAVVAIRRQPDGALGPVLNCVSSVATSGCGTASPSLDTADGILVSPQGRVYVISQYGMDGAITAFPTAADGSLGTALNCVASAGRASSVGCSPRTGLALPQGIAMSSGGTIYVTSFLNYTEGTVVALSTLGDGSIGAEINCYGTTGETGANKCGTTTDRIASPVAVTVGPDGVVYVASSEPQGSYGALTPFATGPGGSLTAPTSCVRDPGGVYPTGSCSATATGIKGARALAISPDKRLYVAGSAYDGSFGTVAAFPLLAFGAIGAELNCFGSAASTGCTPAAGLRGADGLAISGDGTVYVSANYGDADGAATALARQQNGAFTNEIDCVGITSATGCDLRMPGLARAQGIVGSPDPAMQNLYVASRYVPVGTDGALAALTRELPPTCADTSAVAAGQPVAVPVGCSDPNGDPLTRSVTGGPSHGTLDPIDQGAGAVLYRPAAGFVGDDQFTVQATDGTLTSNVGTARVKVTSAPVPPRPPAASAAKLTRFGMTRTRFAVGPRATTLRAARRVPRGSAFRYTLNEAARVRIAIAACRRGTGRQRRNQCARRRSRGALLRSGRPGANSTAFSGRLARTALEPGRYRATITATPPAPAKASAPRSVDFIVVKG